MPPCDRGGARTAPASARRVHGDTLWLRATSRAARARTRAAPRSPRVIAWSPWPATSSATSPICSTPAASACADAPRARDQRRLRGALGQWLVRPAQPGLRPGPARQRRRRFSGGPALVRPARRENPTDTPASLTGKGGRHDALGPQPDGRARREGAARRLLRQSRHRHPDPGRQQYPRRDGGHPAERERDARHRAVSL